MLLSKINTNLPDKKTQFSKSISIKRKDKILVYQYISEQKTIYAFHKFDYKLLILLDWMFHNCHNSKQTHKHYHIVLSKN